MEGPQAKAWSVPMADHKENVLGIGNFSDAF
jgi:hypothetical protein